MLDPAKVLAWAGVTALVLLAVCFLSGVGYLVISGIREDIARDDCGHRGGRAELYDVRDRSLWRCVGAAPEAN